MENRKVYENTENLAKKREEFAKNSIFSKQKFLFRTSKEEDKK